MPWTAGPHPASQRCCTVAINIVVGCRHPISPSKVHSITADFARAPCGQLDQCSRRLQSNVAVLGALKVLMANAARHAALAAVGTEACVVEVGAAT